MSNRKYLVLSGFVVSKNDGQKHYITAPQLIRLYGVNPTECICMTEEAYHRYGFHKPEHLRTMILLCARYDGDYSLPKS